MGTDKQESRLLRILMCWAQAGDLYVQMAILGGVRHGHFLEWRKLIIGTKDMNPLRMGHQQVQVGSRTDAS